ncbi:hypothetical protein E2C01_088544 [Portunus trituberculatus]|uniref:Uncharacterized protein n=1 Tax=Portunus trituberculatus TaxID=210409 RepID=A0A5B7JK61_PORTR|nr:hypothetical protein [Portunus trituberculatus]
MATLHSPDPDDDDSDEEPPLQLTPEIMFCGHPTPISSPCLRISNITNCRSYSAASSLGDLVQGRELYPNFPTSHIIPHHNT